MRAAMAPIGLLLAIVPWTACWGSVPQPGRAERSPGWFSALQLGNPALSIRDSSVMEGDGGTVTLNFPVSVSRAMDSPVSVHYATSDGSATAADADYVPATGILMIDPTPPAWALTWGGAGSGDGQFSFPHALAVSRSGNVFVADRQNHRVQVFDRNGVFLRKWGAYGAGNGQFNNPRGIAVDASEHVYVTDTGNHRLQVFDTNGNFLRKWGSLGSADGLFSAPFGVAVDEGGDVYVADQGNHRVQVFDATGTFLVKWGSQGSGDGQFNSPYGIAVSPGWIVYVTDGLNSRVQVFDAAGTFLGKWGSPGSGDGQFLSPFMVALSSSGTVYVADRSKNQVQTFDQHGAFLTSWTQFSALGVAVDDSGNVFVSQMGGSQIHKFRPVVPSGSVSVLVNGDTRHEADETFTVVLSDPAGATIAQGTGVGTIVNDEPALLHLTDAFPVAADTLRLLFDQAVYQATAETPSNYGLLPSGGVVSASLSDSNAVLLGISCPLSIGDAVTVTVTGVATAADSVPILIPQTREFIHGVLSIGLIQAPDSIYLQLEPCEDRSRFAGPGASAGRRISLRGICTAVFDSVFYLQDSAGGARSGVAVSVPLTPLVPGRQYLIAGAVRELGWETMVTDNAYVRDEGAAAVPDPIVQAISVLRDTGCDQSQSRLSFDDFQGTLVEVDSVEVCENGLGGTSFRVAQPFPVGTDTLQILDRGRYTYAPMLGGQLDVVGVMSYAKDQGKKPGLAPRGIPDVRANPNPPGVHNVPGLSQTKEYDCGPTAAASCLGWWQLHGYPEMWPDPWDFYPYLYEYAEVGRNKRANTDDLMRAIDRLCDLLVYPVKPTLRAKQHPTAKSLATFDYLEGEFEASDGKLGEDVLLLLKFQRKDAHGNPTGPELGHYVTLRSIDPVEGQPNQRRIRFMNPGIDDPANKEKVEEAIVTQAAGDDHLRFNYKTEDNAQARITHIISVSPARWTSSVKTDLDPGYPGGYKFRFTNRLYYPSGDKLLDWHMLVEDGDAANWDVRGLPQGWSFSIKWCHVGTPRQWRSFLSIFPMGSPSAADFFSGQSFDIFYKGTAVPKKLKRMSQQTTNADSIPPATGWAPEEEAVWMVVAQDTTPPGPVGDLTVATTLADSGRVDLSLHWQPPATGAAGYELFDIRSRELLVTTVQPETTLAGFDASALRRLCIRSLSASGVPCDSCVSLAIHRDEGNGIPVAAGGPQVLHYTPPDQSWCVNYDWTIAIPGAAEDGHLVVTRIDGAPAPPFSVAGASVVPPAYSFWSDAGIAPGPIPVSVSYSGLEDREDDLGLRLYNLVNGQWLDVTTAVDTATRMISGTLNELSAVAVVIPGSGTDVPGGDGSSGFHLEPPRPNPFARSTAIGFALSVAGNVRLVVFDVHGRRVATLVDRVMSAGRHEVVWDGRLRKGGPASPGIYIIRLELPGVGMTRKVIRLQ